MPEKDPLGRRTFPQEPPLVQKRLPGFGGGQGESIFEKYASQPMPIDPDKTQETPRVDFDPKKHRHGNSVVNHMADKYD